MTKATITPATHAEIIAVVAAINAGHVAVAIEGAWGYSGAPWFQADNGWRFQVFNDCDEFDYFQTIQAPDGRAWTYEDLVQEDRWWGVYDDLAAKIEEQHRAQWGIE